MRKFTSLVAVAAMLVGAGSTLEAQATRGGTGLMLGLGATYTPSFDFTITSPLFPGESLPVDVDGGIGIAARAGFAFTPVLVVFGAFEQSWHDIEGDDARLQHLYGGLRLNLPVAPSLAPYVSGGYGQRRLLVDDEGDDVRATGNMFDVGGGIVVFLGRSLTLDIGANFAFGEFDELRFPGETVDIDTDNVSTARLRVGFTWMPMTGR